jgi:CheY-like chemotaxis protein/HPt (histidine-containing phosphotransfer) domain-containing protein
VRIRQRVLAFPATAGAARGDIVGASPLPRPARACNPVTETAQNAPGLAPARLLVVDDDPLSSALLAHLALLLGHAATIESDPQRAIEIALGGNFDLMLLDLGMPEIDGFEALRRLREREAAAQRAPLPVIAVTGYASETDRMRCLTAGFNDHLTKPVQASALGAAIARAAGRGETAGAAAQPIDCDAERLRATVRRLGNVRSEDRAFAPTVIESFALRSAQLIESLRTALATRDGAEGARAARALRASAEFLGALRLAAMSKEIEGVFDASAGADSDDAARWQGAGALLDTIDREQQAVLTVLFEATR